MRYRELFFELYKNLVFTEKGLNIIVAINTEVEIEIICDGPLFKVLKAIPPGNLP